MTHRGWLGLVALLLVLLPHPVLADPLDDAVRRIGLQLQCPVCEGQNVADSNSGLARDMRAHIRTEVLAGRTDQQILDEIVASYGEGILTDPPKRGISLGVWIGPIVGVALGVLLVGLLMTSWRRTPRPDLASTGVLEADVNEEFQRFRTEVGP